METRSDMRDIAGFCTQRADAYRLFASLADQEVSEATCVIVRELAPAAPSADADEYEQLCARALRAMAEGVSGFDEDRRDMLACDFARVFLASGRYEGTAAVPYESIYTSEDGILMQDARDEVRALFRKAGVMPAGDDNIPEDYLPFELEYMALLNDRLSAAALAGDAAEAEKLAALQSSFLDEHLLNWTDDLAKDIRRIATTGFYQALADALVGFLHGERKDISALEAACSSLVA